MQSKLTADNNIEVSAEDIRDFAKQQLLGYMGGMTADLDQPWVEDYVQRMMNDRKYVEDAYQRIRSEKLFAWAESQTNPKEKEISAEDFNEMVKNHHH
jgi:trigger factor